MYAKSYFSHFRALWLNDDSRLLSHLYPALDADAAHPTDVFFVSVLAVPPPKCRPCQFTGGMMTTHPQSSGLEWVVKTVAIMKHLLKVRGLGRWESLNTFQQSQFECR